MKGRLLGLIKLATLGGLVILSPGTAAVQAAVDGKARGTANPDIPTTKILAIGRWTAKATLDARVPLLPAEMRATARLYLAGKIDQWYFKTDESGVVLILSVVDLGEARQLLERLPLGQAGLMQFDFIPLGPIKPLGLLLADPAE